MIENEKRQEFTENKQSPIEGPFSESSSENEFISTLQDKSDIPAYYFLSALALTGLLVLFGYMDTALTNVVGIVIPVYFTIKAYEKPEAGDEQQWVTYWGIFSVLMLFDLMMPSFLMKIPLFYFGKFLFLVWLFLPNSRGALTLHDLVFSRFFGPVDLSKIKNVKEKVEKKVDTMLEKINQEKEEFEKNAERERIRAEVKERSEKIQARLDQIQNSTGLSRELSKEMTQSTTLNNADFQQSENKFPSKPIEQTENNKDLSLFQNQENIINRGNFNSDNNSPLNTMNSNTNTTSYETKKAEEEQHESRQNIVSDAKICTENLQAGFQNIQEKFSESAERLKNLKDKSSAKPLDQKSLTSQGMEIASNMRTNMDPNFGMHDAMVEGQEVPAKEVKPILRDEKTDTIKTEDKQGELLESSYLKSKFYDPNANNSQFAEEKKVL